MEVWSRNYAGEICELFEEEIFIKNDICVPSPEDDERDEDDMIGLYGSTWYDFIDMVEDDLVDGCEYENPEEEIKVAVASWGAYCSGILDEVLGEVEGGEYRALVARVCEDALEICREFYAELNKGACLISGEFGD